MLIIEMLRHLLLIIIITVPSTVTEVSSPSHDSGPGEKETANHTLARGDLTPTNSYLSNLGLFMDLKNHFAPRRFENVVSMRYDHFNCTDNKCPNKKYSDPGEYILNLNSNKTQSLWDFGERRLSTVDYYDIVSQKKLPVASSSYVYQQHASEPFQQTLSTSLRLLHLDPPSIDLGEIFALNEYDSYLTLTSLADNDITIKIIKIQTSDDLLIVRMKVDEKFPIFVQAKDPKRIFIIHYIPIFPRYHAAHIFFEIEILKKNMKLNHFLYAFNITSKVIANPYSLKPIFLDRVELNQIVKHTISVFNPYTKRIVLKNAINTEKKLKFVKPRALLNFICSDVSHEDYDSLKDEIIFANKGNDDRTGFQELQPNTTTPIIHVIFKARKPGRIVTFIKINFQNELLQIPVFINVLKPGLNFDRDSVDFGIIGERNVIHERSFEVVNIGRSTVEIFDIIGVTRKGIQLNILGDYNLSTNKIVLRPNETRADLIRVRIKYDEKHDTLESDIRGFLAIISNDTHSLRLSNDKYLSTIDFIVKIMEKPFKYNFLDCSFFLNETQLKQTNTTRIDIKKPLVLQGWLPLILEQVLLTSSYLYIQDYFGPVLITTKQAVKVFTMNLSFIPSRKDVPRKIYIPILVSRYHLALPIEIYDRRLSCALAGEPLVFTRCSERNIIRLNFNDVALHESRKKFLYIKNENSVDIKLFFFKTNNTNLKIFLERFTDDKGKILSEKMSVRSTGNQKGTRAQHLNFKPGYQALILFSIHAYIPESVESSVYLSTPSENISIPLIYSFLNGSLDITPIAPNFPGFPGKVSSKDMLVRNRFNTTVKFKKVKSNDSRIIPLLKINSIAPFGEQTSVIELKFDASKQENFLKITKYHPFFEDSISRLDIRAAWLIKKSWDNLLSTSNTKIRGLVTLETDVINQIPLNVHAELNRPVLMNENVIDFGLHEMGTTVYKNITIYNPSDYQIKFQLFIGPQIDYTDNTESNMEDSYTSSFISYQSEKSEPMTLCLAEKEMLFIGENMFLKLGDLFIDDEKIEDLKLISLSEKEVQILDMLDGKRTLIFKQSLSEIINDDAFRKLEANEALLCKRGWVSQVIRKMLLKVWRNLIEFFKENLKRNRHVNLQQILFHLMHKSTNVEEILAMTSALPRETFDYKLNMSLKEKIFEYLDSFKNNEILKGLSYIWDKVTQSEGKAVNAVKDVNGYKTEQSYFINPIYKNKTFTIPPGASKTIEALLFQPTLSTNLLKNETLYIKNNLTVLYEVPLRGESGMGEIMFTSMKYPEDERDGGDSASQPISVPEELQRKLLFNIEKREFLRFEISKVCNKDSEACANDEDLHSFNSFEERGATRIFVAKNKGNMPITVRKLSINNIGCEAFGFKIKRCEEFTLNPEEEINIHVTFNPSFLGSIFRKSLLLFTDKMVFEYTLEVHLPDINMFTLQEIFLYEVKSYIFLFVAIVLSFVLVSTLSSYKNAYGMKIKIRTHLVKNKRIEIKKEEIISPPVPEDSTDKNQNKSTKKKPSNNKEKIRSFPSIEESSKKLSSKAKGKGADSDNLDESGDVWNSTSLTKRKKEPMTEPDPTPENKDEANTNNILQEKETMKNGKLGKQLEVHSDSVGQVEKRGPSDHQLSRIAKLGDGKEANRKRELGGKQIIDTVRQNFLKENRKNNNSEPKQEEETAKNKGGKQWRAQEQNKAKLQTPSTNAKDSNREKPEPLPSKAKYELSNKSRTTSTTELKKGQAQLEEKSNNDKQKDEKQSQKWKNEGDDSSRLFDSENDEIKKTERLIEDAEEYDRNNSSNFGNIGMGKYQGGAKYTGDPRIDFDTEQEQSKGDDFEYSPSQNRFVNGFLQPQNYQYQSTRGAWNSQNESKYRGDEDNNYYGRWSGGVWNRQTGYTNNSSSSRDKREESANSIYGSSFGGFVGGFLGQQWDRKGAYKYQSFIDNADEEEESSEFSDNYEFSARRRFMGSTTQGKRFSEHISEEGENDDNLFNTFSNYNYPLPQRQFTALNNTNPFSLSQIFPTIQKQVNYYWQGAGGEEIGGGGNNYDAMPSYGNLQHEQSNTGDMELEEEISKEIAQRKSKRPPPGFEKN